MAKKKQSNLYIIFVVIALLFVGLNSIFDLSGLWGEDAPTGSDFTNDSELVEVHFIDVGQGDSIYIKTPSQNILIDAGERGTIVTDYLKALKVDELDLVIGTHPHADHIGGLVNVLKDIKVKEVMDPGIVHTSKTFEEYLNLIDEKNIKFTVGKAGMKRTLGDDAELQILSPTEPDSKNLNEASIVARLVYGDVSFLFTGDAETGSEKEILASGYTVKSTILKAGHHGSSTSTGDSFLDATAPKSVVIMCGKDNTYGHPHKETLEKLDKSDIPVYRTDLLGTIVIKTDGKSYDVIHD